TFAREWSVHRRGGEGLLGGDDDAARARRCNGRRAGEGKEREQEETDEEDESARMTHVGQVDVPLLFLVTSPVRSSLCTRAGRRVTWSNEKVRASLPRSVELPH